MPPSLPVWDEYWAERKAGVVALWALAERAAECSSKTQPPSCEGQGQTDSMGKDFSPLMFMNSKFTFNSCVIIKNCSLINKIKQKPTVSKTDHSCIVCNSQTFRERLGYYILSQGKSTLTPTVCCCPAWFCNSFFLIFSVDLFPFSWHICSDPSLNMFWFLFITLSLHYIPQIPKPVLPCLVSATISSISCSQKLVRISFSH